jgi:hypothetical protein
MLDSQTQKVVTPNMQNRGQTFFLNSQRDWQVMVRMQKKGLTPILHGIKKRLPAQQKGVFCNY